MAHGHADPTHNGMMDYSWEQKLSKPDAGLDYTNMEWKLWATAVRLAKNTDAPLSWRNGGKWDLGNLGM